MTGGKGATGRPAGPTAPTPAQLYDVRYSRFEGTFEPRWRSVTALSLSSAARALGLRRGARAKVWPFLLITLAYLPVVAAVGIPLLTSASLTPADVVSYRQLTGTLSLLLVAFTATTLPSLLTRERRDRVLSLYFATAVSPREYVLGKLLAAVALVSLVSLLPLLALFVGSILTSNTPLEQLRETIGDLPGILLAGVVIACYFAALGLAAGSLTAKRVFAIGGLLAVLLVTPLVSSIAAGVSGDSDLNAFNLSRASSHAAGTLLPGEPIDPDPPADGLVWAVTAAVIVLGGATFAARYRRAEP